MVLDLKGLFAEIGEKIPLVHTIDLSDVDFFGLQPIKAPVEIIGELQNRAGIVSVKAAANVAYTAPCDRCAAETTKHCQIPIEHILMTSVSNEETDEMILVPDMLLDVDELARCDVLLGLPTRHLCRSDCKGLCPVCGKNLNEGDCDCGKTPVDPRFEALKQLIE